MKLKSTIIKLYLIVTLSGIYACGGSSGHEGGSDSDYIPQDNSTPKAYDISIRSDLSTPYVSGQLIGTDEDNDSLIFILDAEPDGEGYTQAFVDSSSGRFYLTLQDDGNDKVILPYKVSDGKLFSDPAEITIMIGEVESGGLGEIDMPEEEYGRLNISYFDGDRYGSNPDDPLSIPSSIDLSGNFPRPGNQGMQGSCVGWATAFALKSYQEKIEEGWDFSESTVFSPAWIYNQINGGIDNGSRIDHALQLIIDKGAAPWSYMPYDDKDYITPPGNDSFDEASYYKAERYMRVSGIQQIKSALANRQPVVAGILIFESFNRISGTHAVYTSVDGDCLGGHAVAIVGYDDAQFGGAFKIINSWGIQWGDGGFFWLPYTIASQVMTQAFVLTDLPNDDHDTDVPVVPIQDDDLPNLEVLSWSATYDPQPGGSGKWYYEVVNSGSNTAGPGADVNLILSKDSRIDTSDWFIVYEEIPFELEPGESAYRDETVPRSFQFPSNLSPGAYYMAVWVDDLQEIEESRENDNVSYGNDLITISLPSLPDIAIDYWWASWNSYTGAGVLEYTVINKGTAATTGTDWDINLVLSTHESPMDGQVYFLFYEDANHILGPGQQVYRNSSNQASFNLFQTKLGSSVPSGTYYMSLWVDDLNQEIESNESNNYSTGNNLVTIYNFAANAKGQTGGMEAYSLNGNGDEVSSTYNGKRLPIGNIALKKVEITDLADGNRQITLLDDGSQPYEQRIKDCDGEAMYEKIIKSKNDAIFPHNKRMSMPDSQINPTPK